MSRVAFYNGRGFSDGNHTIDEHEAAVIIESDGIISKNRYGITGIRIDNLARGLLFCLTLTQIEEYFRELRRP